MKQLNEILEAHKHYLAQDCDEWENMRANLSNADLNGIDLSNANLRGAILCDADLSDADLSWADLSDADLSGADLSDANLRGAFLSDANLSGANLFGAELNNANLRGAYLGNTNLSGASLSGANLSRATLGKADLSGARLYGAILVHTDLSGAKLDEIKYNESTTFFALVCPEEGDFIAWKKVNNIIVKLRVPSEAKRSSATTRKCRCEYAKVLELQNLDGTPYNDDKVVNKNYVETTYKVGEIVYPDSWDDNRWNECSHGIHFFITRDEAVRYC